MSKGRGRPVVKVELTPPQRDYLESLSRRRKAPAKEVERAKIVLLAAEDWSNKSIAERLGAKEHTDGYELEEAERHAERIVELNREQSRIEAQIKHRKVSHLLNESMVAEALGNFSTVFGSLDFEDKTRLMGLLVDKVRVTAIDPEKDKIPRNLGVYDLKIRTSCYRIDVEFCIKALFQEIWNKAVTSSNLTKNGLP